MRITQKCGGCGSTQEIETNNEALAEKLARRWADKHRAHLFRDTKPVPYWPSPTIRWTSGTGKTTYSGTTSAVTRKTNAVDEAEGDW